ncbi:GNAT family N-acetyltransferase [Paenibacillus sp. 1P07SE]|uniref:GNAT family N-acetyltransferase n=1 Tax=Paenibacillus sp. 1P07SE TaxID=3132209 RepID=UPI0039A6B4E1
MERIEYCQVSELDAQGRQKAAEVFVSSYPELGRLSKDQERLIRIIGNAMVPDRFFATMAEGHPVSIMACSDPVRRALQFDRALMRQELGWFKGTAFHYALGKMFHEAVETQDESTGFIEAVATAPPWRGQGMARQLLEHVIAQTPYRHFELEVADTNHAAVAMYKRQGFVKLREIKPPWYGRSPALNTIVTMRLEG